MEEFSRESDRVPICSQPFIGEAEREATSTTTTSFGLCVVLSNETDGVAPNGRTGEKVRKSMDPPGVKRIYVCTTGLILITVCRRSVLHHAVTASASSPSSSL